MGNGLLGAQETITLSFPGANVLDEYILPGAPVFLTLAVLILAVAVALGRLRKTA
jgi:hypothetical protein